MCGIAGILKGQSYYSTSQLTAFAEAMCKQIAHRGPDDAGVWISNDEQCVLGHRRLSIIDLTNHSHQPLVGQKSGLSFNGEIYNYVELAQKLTKQNIQTRRGSDTHTLLAGLEHQGEQFITELDGMFAFAHYHQESQQLLLARDPFGEKPLYYTYINGALAFASEITAFNAIPDFVGEINEDQVSLYLYFQYPPAPHTIFANVFKLSPGSYKRFNALNSYPEVSYFSGNFTAKASSHSNEKAVDRLENILTESLERRLRSDVSLGAFLSGGIDSSLVVSLISKRLSRKIDTYSVGFLGCDKSEHEEAQRIANHLGTQHHTMMFDSSKYVDYLDLMTAHCEPNADTSCIPTFLVAQLAGQDHKVALTGDGGDELFAGYNRYFATLAAAKDKLQEIAARQWHMGNQYVNSLNIVPHKELRTLFGSFPLLLQDVLLQSRRQIDISSAEPLSRFQQTDLHLYLPTVLAKVDRASMAHSLETRTPFLSTDVFAFASQCDISMLYDGKLGKVLLRQLLAKFIPVKMMQTNKVGFSFVGENLANARALSGLIPRFNDEIRDPAGFLNRFFGFDRLHQFSNDLLICSQTKQLQSIWALLLLNSFLKNCRYQINS